MSETAPSLDERIAMLALEYAQVPAVMPLAATMSLRRDLGIDSLSMVSLILRLGDEVEADLLERDIDLARLDTVGDLVALGRKLISQRSAP
jgi:acyl carrier protein